MEHVKNICWLATGGTIASRPTAQGLSPGLTAQEMLNMLPELNRCGSIGCKDIMRLDSTNLQPADWQFIASHIEKLYSNYDAFIITHGTDTLCWTSCALSCMLENTAKPVIVVGSQRTLEEAGSDAKANLNAAFALAQKGYPGVFAVCGGQIIEGLWAKKMYSEDLRSIQSVNKKPVAVFDENGITWDGDYKAKAPAGKFAVHYELETKIAQLKIMPGMDSALLLSLADAGYKGIVIEAYGAGGIPFMPAHQDGESIIAAVEKLTEKGTAVVCVSQCPYDGVHMERYEVGIRACRAGAIPAGKLSAEAAAVKLMTLLGREISPAEIRREFAYY